MSQYFATTWRIHRGVGSTDRQSKPHHEAGWSDRPTVVLSHMLQVWWRQFSLLMIKTAAWLSIMKSCEAKSFEASRLEFRTNFSVILRAINPRSTALTCAARLHVVSAERNGFKNYLILLLWISKVFLSKASRPRFRQTVFFFRFGCHSFLSENQTEYFASRFTVCLFKLNISS